MSESKEGYVFDGVDGELELQRLRSIEAVFDPGTTRMLSRVGPLTGARCLEVGAGAGSIARWLHERVGNDGQVDAIDLDVRFLGDLPRDVRVTKGDATTAELGGQPFGLIHARFVLIHNSCVEQLLDALLARVAVGGCVCIEEPDFASARVFSASTRERRAFEAVRDAIQSVFAERGQRFDFGRVLPTLIRDRGFELVSVECDSPVARGGSELATMMAMSTTQLASKYLATGHVTQADLDCYAEFTKHPASWALYHDTVRVLARRTRAT